MKKTITGYPKRTFIVIFVLLVIMFGNQIIFSLHESKSFLIENYVITPLFYLLDFTIAAIPINLLFIALHKKWINKKHIIWLKIIATGLVPFIFFFPAYLEGSPWHQLYGLIILISNLLVLAFNQDYYEKHLKKPK